MVVAGVFALVGAVAAAHSVDVDRWGTGFDEVSDRIVSRFARCEPLRNAGALMLGLISDLGRKNCWTPGRGPWRRGSADRDRAGDLLGRQHRSAAQSPVQSLGPGRGTYTKRMVDADPAVTFPRRIAVVNRGEAAVRLIRAVRELNAEHGGGITTIALYTDAERRAMFVRQADEAVTLRRTSAGIAYLDHAELERALLESKADAVWVGWGFVAEAIAFAELCARLKLTFIGPPPAAMRTLGDKVEAKLLAEKVGVPLAPWSCGPVETREDARRHAEPIGYPLIIKARSGGGGRGIRKVFSPEGLAGALERTAGADAARCPPPTNSKSHRTVRRAKPSARSATRSCSSNALSPMPAMSRSRSWPTTTAMSGRRECATAPSNAETRK